MNYKCYVKAGSCEKEAMIIIKKITSSIVEVEIETNCDYIKQAQKELKNIKVGEEMSLSMCETKTHNICSKYVCRNSCIIPQAILKAIETEFNIFPKINCAIEFL